MAGGRRHQHGGRCAARQQDLAREMEDGGGASHAEEHFLEITGLGLLHVNDQFLGLGA